MNTTTVAVDLAKSVFELAVSNVQGRVTERKRLSREAFGKFFVNRRPCRVVMEACGTAHFWARTLQALGHKVKLLRPSMCAATRPTRPTRRCCRGRPLRRHFAGAGQVRGPAGVAAVMARVPPWLADGESKIPPVLRKALSEAMAEIGGLDTRIETLEKQLREEARQCPAVQKLMRSPASGC